MAKVFISHAHRDAALVGVFTDFLEGTVGVPAADIFCSSRSGQGIPPGVKFVDDIKRHLRDSQYVIGLITPNLYRSRFSLCELGAAWVLSKKFIPVVVPPLTKKDIPDVMAGIQAVDLGSPDDVAQLALQLQESLEVDRQSYGPRLIQGTPTFIRKLRAQRSPSTRTKVAMATVATLLVSTAGVIAFHPTLGAALTAPMVEAPASTPPDADSVPSTEAAPQEVAPAPVTQEPPAQPPAAAAPGPTAPAETSKALVATTRSEPTPAAPKETPKGDCRSMRVRSLTAAEQKPLRDIPPGVSAYIPPSASSGKALLGAGLLPKQQPGSFEVRSSNDGRVWLLGFATDPEASGLGKGLATTLTLYPTTRSRAESPLCVPVESIREMKPGATGGRSFVELRVAAVKR